MTKTMKLFILPLVAYLLLLPANVQAADLQSPHTITVTGHAETSVSPDIAVATFGVQTSSSDVENAKRENDQIMQKIYEAMLVTGIDRSKVQTAVFSVQPLYKSDNEAVSSYRVQNTISVTIGDMSSISRVIDAAFSAGANQFQGVRFGLKRESELRDDLLKQALLDGKRKALLIAETLGETIGRPASVTETGHFAPVMMDGARFNSLKVSSSTPISSGTITASTDVQMVFELK